MGKTTLVRTLAGLDTDIGGPVPTTAIDCRHVLVKTERETFNLSLVDLPGLDMYRSLTSFAYHNASVVCLVYDAHRPSTLEALHATWLARDIPLPRAAKAPQFVLVRVHQHDDKADYLAVFEAVQAVQDACAARTGGTHTEHVCVAVDESTASRSWDVRRLTSVILTTFDRTREEDTTLPSPSSPSRALSVTPSPPLKPIAVEDVVSLETFDVERTHFLSSQTARPTRPTRPARPSWCPKLRSLSSFRRKNQPPASSSRAAFY